MIIVSQEKDVILNFDNAGLIAIDDEETNKRIYASCNNDDVLKLGVYESNERAKKVLQEIINTYEKTQYYKYGFEKDKEYIYEIADNLFKYEMPEK